MHLGEAHTRIPEFCSVPDAVLFQGKRRPRAGERVTGMSRRAPGRMSMALRSSHAWT